MFLCDIIGCTARQAFKITKAPDAFYIDKRLCIFHAEDFRKCGEAVVLAPIGPLELKSRWPEGAEL